MGRERKRGAICDFIHFLRSGEGEFFLFEGDYELIRGSRFAITLDRDTRCDFASIKSLIAVAAHPLNAPFISGGRVISGSAVISPSIVNLPESRCKNAFSLLMCRSCGRDFYSGCAFDFESSVFGYGSFYGKGIFDTEAFDRLMHGTLPTERILSHDILEGELLRAGVAPSSVMEEDFPTSQVSFLKREHRWTRGDLQLVPFLLTHYRDECGRRVKNPLSLVSRLKILDNALCKLSYISGILAIILSIKLNELSALTVIALIFAQEISAFISSLKNGRQKIEYPQGEHREILLSLATLLYSVSFLPSRAVNLFDALITSVYRMTVTKRKLLEWQPFESAEKHGFTHKRLISVVTSTVLGGALFIFAGAFSLKIIGAIFITNVFISPLLSKDTASDKLSKKNSELISRWAFDHWRFYEDTVSAESNHLPPDSISMPEGKIDYKTSPTNIGMYLSSTLAARDFGFITTRELTARLKRTLSVIASLPKAHGNLYNWYDTRTLEPLPSFSLSSVDSGNLCASLIALSEGVKEYISEDSELSEISRLAARLALDCDFSKYYSDEKKLLSVSIDHPDLKKSVSYYDNIMSEARLAYYFAISKGDIPIDAWWEMKRICAKRGAYVGALSFFGTAFEYLMPALFLKAPPSSLISESLHLASKTEKEKSVFGIWGISESAFISSLNEGKRTVGYAPHGISELSVSDASTRKIISPYSSFLLLSQDCKGAVLNLLKMRRMGYYGRYGFYEAIDFESSRSKKSAAVKLYMAHHVGMSIVASANAALDFCFTKRFMSFPLCRSAISLMRESAPTISSIKSIKSIKKGLYGYKNEHQVHKNPESSVRRGKEESCPYKAMPLPSLDFISNSFFTCVFSGMGHIYLFTRDFPITKNPFIKGEFGNRERSFSLSFSGERKKYMFPPKGAIYCSYNENCVQLGKEDNIKIKLHKQSKLCEISFSFKSQIKSELELLIPCDEAISPDKGKVAGMELAPNICTVSGGRLELCFNKTPVIFSSDVSSASITFDKARRAVCIKGYGNSGSIFISVGSSALPCSCENRTNTDQNASPLPASSPIIRRYVGMLLSLVFLKDNVCVHYLSSLPPSIPDTKRINSYPAITVLFSQSTPFSHCDRVCEYLVKAKALIDGCGISFNLVFIVSDKRMRERITRVCSASGADCIQNLYITGKENLSICELYSQKVLRISSKTLPDALPNEILKDFAIGGRLFSKGDTPNFSLSGRKYENAVFSSDGIVPVSSRSLFSHYALTTSTVRCEFSKGSIGRTYCKGKKYPMLHGEKILLTLRDGRVFDIVRDSYLSFFGEGFVRYTFSIDGVNISVTVTVDRYIPAKAVLVSGVPCDAKVCLIPSIALSDSPTVLRGRELNNTFFRKPSSEEYEGSTVILRRVSEKENVLFVLALSNQNRERTLEYISQKYRSQDDVSDEISAYASRVRSSIALSTNEKSMLPDFLINYLLRDEIYSRVIFGRASIYEMLLSSLVFLSDSPELSGKILIKAAASLTESGSFLSVGSNGTALVEDTRCLLLFSYALCEYYLSTGDIDLFQKRVLYLDRRGTASRYRESIYLHAVRALEFAERDISSDDSLFSDGSENKSSFQERNGDFAFKRCITLLLEKRACEGMINLSRAQGDSGEISYLTLLSGELDERIKSLMPDESVSAFYKNGLFPHFSFALGSDNCKELISYILSGKSLLELPLGGDFADGGYKTGFSELLLIDVQRKRDRPMQK